jgi:peptidyl-prolyl cis-trans isomerase B (cyclophilin B)
MMQGGDPLGNGTGGADNDIVGEFKLNGHENPLSHKAGVVSMARATPYNSGSSQFFIVHKDSTYLDGSYASFGKVFAGLDVVDKIASVDTDYNDRPTTEQKIHSIRFVTVEKE